MNRFAAEHPEDWEQRLDSLTDSWDMRDKTEPKPRCGGSEEIKFNPGYPDPQTEDSYPCPGCPDCWPS